MIQKRKRVSKFLEDFSRRKEINKKKRRKKKSSTEEGEKSHKKIVEFVFIQKALFGLAE